MRSIKIRSYPLLGKSAAVKVEGGGGGGGEYNQITYQNSETTSHSGGYLKKSSRH